MPTETYHDLQVVHQYLDEITTFIQGLVGSEDLAIVMATHLFVEHKKEQAKKPFINEESRKQWLLAKAGKIAKAHLAYEKRENKKNSAIRAAIHDYPQTAF